MQTERVCVCICVCTQARMKIERSSESNVPSKSAMKFYVMENEWQLKWEWALNAVLEF